MAEQQRLADERKRLEAEQQRLQAEQERIVALQKQQKEAYINKLSIYRDFELNEQVEKAIRERTLSEKAKEDLKAIKSDLLKNSWWRQQDATLLAGIVASYINAMSTLTFDLLAFDNNSPTMTSISTALNIADKALVDGKFDAVESAKIIRDVAIIEKFTEGDPLAKAMKV